MVDQELENRILKRLEGLEFDVRELEKTSKKYFQLSYPLDLISKKLVETIIGNIVTTGFVNALSVNAATVNFYDSSGDSLLSIGSEATITQYIQVRTVGNIGLAIQNQTGASAYTGELLSVDVLGATSTGNTARFLNNGLGYSLNLAVGSNANRVNPTLYIEAVSGQGAHIGMNPLADAPANPITGNIYYSTDTHWYGWNGAAWKQLDN